MTSDFRRQINACKDKVDAIQEKAVRLIALKTFGNIVTDTPVDTGRARSNWHIQLNTVDVSLVEPGAANPDAKALPVIGAYKLKDTIFISNNLPYIRRLNEGYSTQAPAGFVDSGIQRGVRQGKELAKQ